MAQRRMFSKAIVDSEEFNVMPKSTQALYFHLGMHADDDGFIHPGKIMRSGGYQDDDLKILLAKRFLLSFESGVVVVKHWLIHNLIQKDRYSPTRFQEELKSLFIKENKAYTDRLPASSQSGNTLLPQVRLGKDSITSEDTSSQEELTYEYEDSPKKKVDTKRVKDKETIFTLFSEKWQPWWVHKQQREAALRLFDRGVEKVRAGKKIMKDNEGDQYCPQADTPFDYEKKLPQLARYMKRNGIEV